VSSPLGLTTIKVQEHLIGGSDELVIGRKGIRQLGGATKKLLQDLASFGLG
jgi:hypothetical protein